jgi:RNase H-like domain found in reverse transcriptase
MNELVERWSTVEKEGFALVESLERFDFLVAGRELSLFTDHANLIYIFYPTGQNPVIQRHTASKLLRWALRLSGYRHTIEHLAGGRNIGLTC